MEITEALRRIDLFSSLDDEILNELASAVIRRQFAKNEVIVSQDGTSEGLFIILRGRVKVEGTYGGATVHAELGPEQFFGEMPLLDEKPRPATITGSRRPNAWY